MENSIQLNTRIITIKELLTFKGLKLPVYQRPYKWQEVHIQQLIEDIQTFKNKSSYRLGTLVIHKDGNDYNIVDGQQRTISCILLFKAICKTKENIDKQLQVELGDISDKLVDFTFSNNISKANISQNYKIACRSIAKLNEDFISFFLNKCEFVYSEINQITEAFQFFDAQNARGKDLAPHDLLKAYHLREYSKSEEKSKLNDVEAWENYQTENLTKLFGDYLFRIRSWSRGESGFEFDKNKIHLFKGVTISNIDDYNYTKTLKIVHHYIDEYNNSYHRNVDGNIRSYPFQLDAPIINGRRFFEMIGYYKQIFDLVFDSIKKENVLNAISKNIFEAIKRYPGCNRVGDTYVRTLFECALVFYVDKYGLYDINNAVEKIFAWAYKLRLVYYAIQFKSVDNYVLQENMFLDIKNSYTSREALQRVILFDTPIQREIKEIEEILSELYYI
ncbi:DUF262 domain-containing protein [Myroides marinus]|uniref:DUF262 domain-containing protein n=1 Tax=Myroides marinus TaxID=703342 RepID=UPI002577AF1B|nr:DUF262 domain-containing protein [Myroides marinus]MDM1405307.1 DUF262 domain-containing protein [Myroides marinus]